VQRPCRPVAFFATLINYLDRQALSVAAPVLLVQFHMSNIDYSRILFAFMLAYTLMNGVSGVMIDRLGTRAGYALFVGWWSLCALLHALAQGMLSLGVFRFLLGLGEAGSQNAPLGRAVIGGLLLATITTLFVVPMVYSMLRTKVPVDHDKRIAEEEREYLSTRTMRPEDLI